MITSDFLGTSFHGNIFLITVYLQEHGPSSARGNLIGLLGNPRHDIV